MVLNNVGNTIAKYDYEPFGKPISLEDGKTRSKYIYKEQDNESKLADHGVRKYDYDLGRFLSIDKLWEKYYGWTPYQYSMNNPISFIDFDGKKLIYPKNKEEKQYYQKLVSLVRQSETGRELLKVAEGPKCLIRLNFGEYNTEKQGDFKPEKQITTHDGSVFPSKEAIINIYSSSTDYLVTFSHELKHASQVYKENKFGEFLKESSDDYKNKVPWAERPLEIEANNTSSQVSKEIPKEINESNLFFQQTIRLK